MVSLTLSCVIVGAFTLSVLHVLVSVVLRTICTILPTGPTLSSPLFSPYFLIVAFLSFADTSRVIVTVQCLTLHVIGSGDSTPGRGEI